MVSTFRNRAGWISLADCLGRLVHWFAVASHGTSDMLTSSGVTELLARAKGKRLLDSILSPQVLNLCLRPCNGRYNIQQQPSSIEIDNFLCVWRIDKYCLMPKPTLTPLYTSQVSLVPELGTVSEGWRCGLVWLILWAMWVWYCLTSIVRGICSENVSG